jgi:hypothetical protein
VPYSSLTHEKQSDFIVINIGLSTLSFICKPVGKIFVAAVAGTSPTTRMAGAPPLKSYCLALNEANAKTLLQERLFFEKYSESSQ